MPRPHSYRPKNELDGFLKEVLGGKYKYRRYAIFEDFIKHNSSANPKELIAKFQATGIPDFQRGGLRNDLKNWLKLKRAEHASKAAKAKANKHPKWSQSRRLAFVKKKYSVLRKLVIDGEK